MRIPSKINAPDRSGRADRAKDVGNKTSANKSATPSRTAATGGVKATVSTRAVELADENSVNVQKVNQLRELIESGQFVMDFQLIAERIVSSGG